MKMKKHLTIQFYKNKYTIVLKIITYLIRFLNLIGIVDFSIRSVLIHANPMGNMKPKVLERKEKLTRPNCKKPEVATLNFDWKCISLKNFTQNLFLNQSLNNFYNPNE